jgi:PhoD-like phosphatase
MATSTDAVSTDVSSTHEHERVYALAVLIVLVSVVSTLAVATSPPVDEPVYLWLRDWELLDALGVFAAARSVPFVLAACAAVLLAWRHRVVLVASLAAVAVSALVAAVTPALFGRDRPFDGPVTGTDSYPSPAVLVLTTVAVLLPLCLRVLTPERAVRRAVTTVAWVVIVGTALDEVHRRLRWPLDEVGAVVIGAAVGVTAWLAADLLLGWEAERPVRPWMILRQPGRPLYRLAVVWTVMLVAVLGGLAVTRGIPRLPESGVMGPGLEVPLHAGLLALLLIGTLLTRWWHMTGAVIVAFAAMLLAYASSVEYAPWVALVVLAAAFVPALLLWVEWHRRATLRAVLGVAVVLSVLMAGTLYAAATNFTYYWGPTHPESASPGPDATDVEWMWAGAVTSERLTVRARTADDASVRLVVSRSKDVADDATYSRRAEATGERVVSLSVTELQPSTDYYYALELDGVIGDRVGRVRTFPAGPASFRFVVAADARTGSNGKVYDAVRATQPLLYLNVGDFFYGDVNVDDPAPYRLQYEANLTAPAQARLYADAPIAYTWGDHDFAGNDSDGTAVGRPAALQVYREYVPHYPLRGKNAPIFQTFTVGRVRFVLTDNRSEREPSGAADRSMLGADQLRWLFREFARADDYGLLVWANADPWVDAPDPGGDTWGGFAHQRRVISRAIARFGVDNLLMVSGDAHMLAFDDGSHTDYSGTGRAGFPLFHAAALDRKPSKKGGPYSGPVVPGSGQFGVVDVEDDGQQMSLTLTGRTWDDEVVFVKRLQIP